MLSDFKDNPTRTTPYALLEKLKQHPSIAPLIAGGEMKEYAAHLIPEGGFNAMPKIYGDGWMIVGDSGGFVNAVHREGSNLAMTTGRLAAETVIAAKAAGKEMTAATLEGLQDRAGRQLRHEGPAQVPRHAARCLHDSPQFFTTYPELCQPRRADSMLTVDGVDKKTKEREIFSQLPHGALAGRPGG